MKVLLSNEWRGGFLDPECPAGSCRIRPLGMVVMDEIDGLYFVRPRSVRLLLNYRREIGLRAVARKALSRLAEKDRNQKFVVAGYGVVIEDGAAAIDRDSPVCFLATCHPAASERVVVDRRLVWPIDLDGLPRVDPGELPLVARAAPGANPPTAWKEVAGWLPQSGRPLPGLAKLRQETLEALESSAWPATPGGQGLSEVRIRRQAAPRAAAGARPTAVLFGYGNYAKTVILPSVSSHLSVTCIHEIDPLQIPARDRPVVTWDTRSTATDDAEYSAFLIAGYHHTHADLAVTALERGASAVVEKPLVVDRGQLQRLAQALERSSGSLFACFHKRHSPVNAWIREDLRLAHAAPVSYHCIVYEVPLPARHWYRWPNSQSRIVSNGCHWIDHFLFLNQFSEVVTSSLSVASDDTLSCMLELRNGAVFTMTLTDQGSERIGLQEYVELRTGTRTVTVKNGSRYTAEAADRVLRRASVRKTAGYTRMYRSIAAQIANGETGESPESLRASAATVLELNEQWLSLRQGGSPPG